MLKEKIKRFVFDHPWMLEMAKRFLFNRYVANNFIYKYLVIKKAERFNREKNRYKQMIFIENTLSCNSRCVFCAHHNKVMAGTMTTDLYKKIIDECYACGINNITFGVYGEPLMDKYLFERIKYLRKYNMTYGIITNASLMTYDKVDSLFQMGGLTFAHFSVNGFSREVYEKTMIGLKRDITYKHVLYFLKQKEERKANNLVVNISIVKTKLSEKDIKGFFNYWRSQKGINMILPVELFDRMGKEYNGEIGELGPLTNKNNWLSPCRSLWGTLMIYYDGKAAPCCQDNDKRELIVGDLTRQTVKEVSTGEALNNLRQCHLAGRRKYHPVCGKCFVNSIWFD